MNKSKKIILAILLAAGVSHQGFSAWKVKCDNRKDFGDFVKNFSMDYTMPSGVLYTVRLESDKHWKGGDDTGTVAFPVSYGHNGTEISLADVSMDYQSTVSLGLTSSDNMSSIIDVMNTDDGNSYQSIPATVVPFFSSPPSETITAVVKPLFTDQDGKDKTQVTTDSDNGDLSDVAIYASILVNQTADNDDRGRTNNHLSAVFYYLSDKDGNPLTYNSANTSKADTSTASTMNAIALCTQTYLEGY